MKIHGLNFDLFGRRFVGDALEEPAGHEAPPEVQAAKKHGFSALNGKNLGPGEVESGS